MPFIKLLAATHFPGPAFRHRADYAELWRRMRGEFPLVFSAVIMPDHVHVTLETKNEEETQVRWRECLRAYARSRGTPIWSKIKPPERILNQKHLQRMVRYDHLNPCREGLVRDPLSWEWSTHRDIMGAVADPWPDPRRVGPLSAFHAYVSSDPSVAVAGTPPPQIRRCQVASLDAIELAVLSATRAASLGRNQPPGGRRQVVQLVRQIGGIRREAIADKLGLTPQTISVMAQTRTSAVDQRVLRAATLILSDARLLQSVKK